MTFDLSRFGEVCGWLFDTGKSVFESFTFDFGDYSFNGWALLVGIAVFSLIVYFLARIFQ